MDCDYVIKTDNGALHIEVAGFLMDYYNDYYNDIKIKDKIKESYRLTLSQKEFMLKANNLNYYIIFPQSYPENQILEEDLDFIQSSIKHEQLIHKYKTLT